MNRTPHTFQPADRSWYRKCTDAARGAGLAYRRESSLHVQIAAAIVTVAVSLYFQISPMEWCLIALAIFMVLTAEVLNTALERLAKATGQEFNVHIRDALDIGGGAVLTAAFGAVIVGTIVFVPYLLRLMPVP